MSRCAGEGRAKEKRGGEGLEEGIHPVFFYNKLSLKYRGGVGI